MTDAIEVVNVTKSFGKIKAVDDISFNVVEGEIFGFLGPNGAGKTTTIRMLSCLIKADKGDIKVFGHDVLKDAVKAKQIMGIIPEMANAYVDLSGWDNLMLIGGLYGIPKDVRQQKAEELLKEFNLIDRKRQLVKGYSKGMKQKLLLCMALINDPRILLLDEPTSGLDVESTFFIRDFLKSLNKQGVTIFISTHNMDDVNKLCDRISIMNHGKILITDKIEAIKNKTGKLRVIEVGFNKKIDFRDLADISIDGKIDVTGNKVRFTVESVNFAITKIVSYSEKNLLQITSLNTLAPSLEEVFMRLTRS